MSYFTLWSPARQTSRSESPQSHFLVQFVNWMFVFASLLSPHLASMVSVTRFFILLKIVSWDCLLLLSRVSDTHSQLIILIIPNMCWWSYQSWQDTLTFKKTALPTASLTRFFPTLRSLMLHRYELPHIAKIRSNHLLFVADWYSVFSLLPS